MARTVEVTFTEALTEQERARMARIAARDNSEVPGYITLAENGFSLAVEDLPGWAGVVVSRQEAEEGQARASAEQYAEMLVQSFRRAVPYAITIKSA